MVTKQAADIQFTRQAVETSQIPPLENGDRLTRYEFERRYQAMPYLKKAELIEGVVYMPSPVRFTGHGQPHAYLITWLGTYCATTPGVELGDNATVRLDADNEPQPDALVRLEPTVGGQSHIGADDYVEGPPELIVEIAGSSAAYDLYDKLNVYRRCGVQEYIVWQIHDERLDWFTLEKGEYTRLEADAEGILHSQIFPGLRLDTSALLAGDLAQVLAKLQEGLASPQYTGFVQKLTAS